MAIRKPGATIEYFYPRPPRGGRPNRNRRRNRQSNHFYPRPPRGGRLKQLLPYIKPYLISIHALREEGDVTIFFHGIPPYKISIHALREEGDGGAGVLPHPKGISIHALREEGDGGVAKATPLLSYFYPRPPRGGRPSAQYKALAQLVISIHALREEGDCSSTPPVYVVRDFYPRPPRGGRPRPLQDPAAHTKYFYPRPPRGGRRQKQRENPLLLSHYTPLCTNCKEVPVKQTAKSHRYLCKRLVFRCEASGKTMCAACSHWRGIKRSAHYPAQTPGAAQHARP